MTGMERLAKSVVVPVVVLDKAEDAIPTAKAMAAGGVDTMEITFRTACAPEAIKAVAENCPEVLVGAGTIINVEQAKLAVEMGAKTAYMQPNQAVLDYVAARAVRPYEVMYTDPDFTYAESHVFDVSTMEPVVSCPHDVDNVHPITEVAPKKIPLNQAYIGSCTNGRTEDIAQAAAILKGKKIPKYSRLLVVPASKEVMQECIEKG